MPPPERPAPFITFYSFKGGVGRSMALINVAGIMAGKRGFRVLAIDFDLEAPGISYLDPENPEAGEGLRDRQEMLQQPGIVDLLLNAKTEGEDGDLFTMPMADVIEKYTRRVRLPEGMGDFDDGELRIMPAGRLAPGSGYTIRLRDLDLAGLYQEGLGEPLIRALKKLIVEADLFDCVLIDSRTGFSDEAGVCTRDLADHLVVLSGLNRQNVEGTCNFLRTLNAVLGGPKKTLQVVLSPVPTGEDDLVDARTKEAGELFSEAWGEELEAELEIPYHPRLALTEEPYVFRRRRGYLAEAYFSLELNIMRDAGKFFYPGFERADEALRRGDTVAVLSSLRHVARVGGWSSIGSFIEKNESKLSEATEKPTIENAQIALLGITSHSAYFSGEGGARLWLKMLKSMIIKNNLRICNHPLKWLIAMTWLESEQTEWLSKLAEVLAGERPPEDLDEWEAWREV